MRILLNCSGTPASKWQADALKDFCKQKQIYQTADFQPPNCQESQVLEDLRNYIDHYIFPEALKICGSPADVFSSVAVLPERMPIQIFLGLQFQELGLETGYWVTNDLYTFFRVWPNFTKGYRNWDRQMKLSGLYAASPDSCRFCGYYIPFPEEFRGWKICSSCKENVLGFNKCLGCQIIIPETDLIRSKQGMICKKCLVNGGVA